jgi:Asp-tRNA(Asn)/Glu-tRNA(Gln) amidotransferase A subunit family amidase
MKARTVTRNKTLQDWLDTPVKSRRELFEDSIGDARRIQSSHNAYISVAESSTPGSDGLLADIPFAVKDNIDVAGFETTAGAPFFRGTPPVIDANVVSALAFEGGTVIGKTNLHELAFGVTSDNGEFGPVRNPLDHSLSAGGSSGGSAAAVALGNVPFALGTDTGGSITVPASFCGIVGFRPTTGRYPGDGVVNLSWSRDTVGIHANRVGDIRTIDRLITRSPISTIGPSAGEIRLGVPSSYLEDLDPVVASITRCALDLLESAGLVLVPVDMPDAIELAATAGFSLVFFETGRTLPARAAALPEPFSSLGIGDMATLAGSPDVGAVLAMIAESGPGVVEYEEARAARWRLRAQQESLFAQSGIDALVFPSVPVLPPPVGENDAVELNGRELPLFPTVTRHSGPGSFAGSPMLSLPAGRTESGLSVGITLEGQFASDESLLSIASIVESIL